MPSESPKWIALALSLIALTISGLSWWESHRGRIINEEINRPVLALSKDIEIVERPEKSQSLMAFTASLKNVGKTTAIINNLEFEGGLSNPTTKCKIEGAHITPTTYPANILSGEEVALTASAWIRPKCKSPPVPSLVKPSLSVTYTDSVTGKGYFQQLQQQ